MKTQKASRAGCEETLGEFDLDDLKNVNPAELHSLRVRNKSLLKQQEFLQEELRALEKQFDVALAIKAHARDRFPVIKPKFNRASQSIAVGIASDWHVEETIDPRTVNGLNEFTLDIADARIKAFFTNLLASIQIQRHGTDIETLILGLLGDFMSGYIHPELVENNSMSPVETILWLMPRMRAGIKLLQSKGDFKRIIVPCCKGNHGRTTDKMRVSTSYKNSYEWLMYHVLAQSFDDPRIEFVIGHGYHTFIEAYRFKIRFHHGEEIKYGGGVGGLTIPVNKAVAQWDKSLRADYDIFGHWHQFKIDNKWISNGSLIGYGPYSIKIKADPEPPRQGFCLIHEKHGRSITSPIWLR